MAAALGAALIVFALASTAVASSGGISTDDGGGTAPNATKQSAGSKAKYRRMWRKVSNRNRRWAKRTARCESGGNPRAVGGGGRYRGAFQFMKSTWRAAPKSPGGDPIVYTYKTQAVVAVALKRREGAHHWPNCG